MTGAPATALVIDDEGLVRKLVRRMLEPDFCRVLEAGDGEAGLRLIERRGDAIDVVLTDLRMPGIDGYDLLGVLAAHRPDLPVACMSGFADDSAVERRILVPFIPKPFDAPALRRLLEPLIAQRVRRRRNAAHHEAIDLVAAAHELRRRRAGDRSTG